MKFWDQYESFEEADLAWENQKALAEKKSPLKVLKNLPQMEGITPDTRENLRWKSFKWMVLKDQGFKVLKSVLRHPIRHLKRYVKSLFSQNPYRREGDFFFYGVSSKYDFEKLLFTPNTLLVLGFSYCHKPFECPSGRFTDGCIHDLENPVCRQCFIGKSVHAAGKAATIPVYIPTVHYIGNKVFEIIEKHPDKQVIFLITACEMTLTMFADWGNMAGIKGIGVRLDGRICNTLKAFQLSEEGIKPGLTEVLPETQSQMLRWIQQRRSFEGTCASS